MPLILHVKRVVGREEGEQEICFVVDVLDVMTGVLNTCKTNLTVMRQFESTVPPKQSGSVLCRPGAFTETCPSHHVVIPFFAFIAHKSKATGSEAFFSQMHSYISDPFYDLF